MNEDEDEGQENEAVSGVKAGRVVGRRNQHGLRNEDEAINGRAGGIHHGVIRQATNVANISNDNENQSSIESGKAGGDLGESVQLRA